MLLRVCLLGSLMKLKLIVMRQKLSILMNVKVLSWQPREIKLMKAQLLKRNLIREVTFLNGKMYQLRNVN